MTSETCIFCAGPAGSRRQLIAGERFAVCDTCGTLGRAVLDHAGAASLQCLHLLACEIEREAEGLSEFRRFRRVLTALRRGFAVSAFRIACPHCGEADEWAMACNDGTVIFTDIPGIAGLPPGSYEPPPRGLSLTPVATEGLIAFGAISKRLVERRASADAAAMRHWALVNRYGPGLRDGDFWITREGEALLMAAEDRVFPMTKADKAALAADHFRARRWRGGGDE